MNISFDNGQTPPESAFCWYLAQMLSTPEYLDSFLHEYLGLKINLTDVKIVREKTYTNKRIDLCVHLTDSNNKKYGIVFDVKIDWPVEKQLATNVSLFEEAHKNYEKVYSFHFLSTVHLGQLNALSDHTWQYKIIKIKDFLTSYCKSGITKGHSLQWASDLQRLVAYLPR